MASKKQNHPLPPCPSTPNCVRVSKDFKAGIEQVYERLLYIFEKEAHKFEVIDAKRIELHAVYRIPFLGFKDDVDVIMEESNTKTVVYIRSASRVGTYDLGVNNRRVRWILKKIANQL
ncbi:MAG: DUF1499 domain-containing protein [Gracilimonas sp.]|uniref:DUF1499 domain-containing protein n=1 Tax=Gracilimonas sp. TaxID=1974203 RepID=UPI0019A36026|nr:DUF1499 domain-containing protein [Gracilimonas sp.]MBD3615224.1 DUF1499 domain-containing protein [Gracilimonas sp.]